MIEAFKVIGRFIIDNEEANKEIGNTTRKAKDAEGSLVSSFKKIGAAVATYFAADKIIEFGKGCIQAAADANAANSQFSQVFGELESKAKASLSGIADETGIVETRMKGSYTQIAAFAKTSGMDTEAALGLSNRAMVAVADSAAFYDRTLEETTESLQSFLKGNFENDAALGLSCTETTRNAAANALYGKSFKDLSESQKQLTLLQMVEDANKASGALGQAARESNTWTNQTGNLKQAFTNFQAVLGQPILQTATNIVGGLAEKVSNLAQKFSEGENPVQTVVDKVSVFLKWCKDTGSYVATTFKPAIESIKTAFTTTKDALQPLIDKITNFITEGDLAKGVTDGIKTAADLLSTGLQSVADFVTSVVTGFQDMVQWGKDNETTIQMIAIAIGTLTAAIGAYNIAAAIKNAGGIVEIAQLAILQVQLWALSAAETAHSIAAGIAATATTALGAAVSFLTSPITLVILAIGALVAIGVLLYKNWDTIKEKMSQLGEKLGAAWETIKTKCGNAIKAVINFFKELPGKIWDWLAKSIEKIKKWSSDLGTKAKEAATKFLNNVITKVKELPGKVWTWLTNVIEKVTSWASNMANKAKNAALQFLNNVINTIKNLPGKIWSSLTSVVSKIVSWGSEMVAKGKAAAQKLLTAVVTKVKEMPGKIKNVGLDIVKGIGNGITNGLSWIRNKIKSFVGNVTKFIKKLFGIKSPSTVMRDEVGRELAAGVAVGIEKNISKVQKAAEEMNQKVLDAAQKRIDDYKVYNNMTLAEEAGFWDEVRQQIAEGTDARVEADKKYLEAKKAVDDQILTAEQTLQSELDEIAKKVTDRQKKIMETFDLFGSFDPEKSGLDAQTELILDLDAQISAMERYNAVIDNLESRIGGTALFDELKGMGVDSVGNLQHVANMTDAELQMYSKMFDEKLALAGKMAKEELAPETLAETQKAYEKFATTCSEMGVDISTSIADSMGNAVATVSNSLDLIKQAFEAFAVDFDFSAFTSAPTLSSDSVVYSINSATADGSGSEKAETGTLSDVFASIVEQKNMMQKLIEMLTKFFPELIEAFDVDIFINGRVLAAELAPDMNDALGRLSGNKERGR